MARYNVVPDNRSDANTPWRLKKGGRTVSRHRKQGTAIKNARKKGNKGDEVYVHNHDGQIREHFTIGG